MFVLWLVVLASSLMVFSCAQPTPELNALILTGQNNHTWQRSSIHLQHILEKSGIFTVERAVSPASGEDMSEFIVDFTPYDVVVLDYNGDHWPEQTRQNFLSYVEGGGGVVVYHAANNSFADWPEFNQIIGLGGWGGRDEQSGPYVYVQDGEVVRDYSPGRGGSHGPMHAFVVEAHKPDHPVLRGLPARWMQANDELYAELRGPAENMEVLAYAYASRDMGGTGRNEPILMTIQYGEGRVFHTTLGHVWGGRFHESMESAGFIVTLQRGAEWAATGRVTQPVPTRFPDDQAPMIWPYFEDIHSDIPGVLSRIADYQPGERSDAFVILRALIAEYSDDAQRMDEIHATLVTLLRSGNTTVHAKRKLLTDFSFIANDSYRSVYERLLRDEELAGEAQFALETLSL